jgi:hypothetical protein
MSAAN